MLALYDPSVPFYLLALIVFNISNLIIEDIVTFASNPLSLVFVLQLIRFGTPLE
jgi:hypothetical protein